MNPITYVRRVGRHHFAYLRAVAESIDVYDCAQRYLGIEHGHEAKSAHMQTVDAVRGIARRRGERAWRLIGLGIKIDRAENVRPSLDDFMGDRGLDDGWSEADIQEMYSEAYPPDVKTVRREKLRERQLALLRHLEDLASETPSPDDLVSGWFDDVTAKKLIAAGMISLGALSTRICMGGVWYANLPGVGRGKAERIKAHLATLLPDKDFYLTNRVANFGLSNIGGDGPLVYQPLTESNKPADIENVEWTTDQNLVEHSPLVIRSPTTRLTTCLLDATNDKEAVDAWIAARAGSTVTATTYKREATRILLWLQHERQNKELAAMTVNDCRDYMAFLQNIPDKWISRVRAAPGEPGWAPFRGPLSHKSHRQAIVIIASFFGWLQSAQYLPANPWLLINQKTGDDREEKMLDTKAVSEGAMVEIFNYINSELPSPSTHRIKFILRFVEAVGLRSAELIEAKLSDFSIQPGGWVMQVHGKGSKNRIAIVPGQALTALQDYLQARGLGNLQTAPPNAPLLASIDDPMAHVGYHSLYKHVRMWFTKAVSASALSTNERNKLQGASTHWLRHTFGTRAIAREVPLDVIQAQMGHASIQTTTATYGRAPMMRRVDEIGKAFG